YYTVGIHTLKLSQLFDLWLNGRISKLHVHNVHGLIGESWEVRNLFADGSGSGIGHFDNIKLIRGNFDHTLSAAIASMPSIDLAFIDGNHRYEPTITYISTILPHLNEFSCLILDDIHWSTEMEKVWEDVKKVPEATLTIDLFFLGLVFFRNDFYQKQHFTIRF
ncbi:MAG: class I SAM-dependent methyltransferase, partial [Sphingobacteriales bacterium]